MPASDGPDYHALLHPLDPRYLCGDPAPEREPPQYVKDFDFRTCVPADTRATPAQIDECMGVIRDHLAAFGQENTHVGHVSPSIGMYVPDIVDGWKPRNTSRPITNPIHIEVANEMVDTGIAAGLLEYCRKSENVSAIHFVKKHDGTLRATGDYRHVNTGIRDDYIVATNSAQQLGMFAGAQYVSGSTPFVASTSSPSTPSTATCSRWLRRAASSNPCGCCD